MTMHPWMTTAEVAQAIGKTRQWVARLVEDKKLVGRKTGGTWLVTGASVKRYLTKRK